MSSAKTSEKQLSELQISPLSDSEGVNINDFLNDDCFIHIFEYLSSLERLKIELVCKRWQLLSKRSWRNFKELIIYESQKNLSMKYLLNVIRRSGPYISQLIISFRLKLNHPQLFKEISIHCKNITEFSLSGDYDFLVKSFPCKNIASLFQSNKKISKIYLEQVKLDSKILLNLNPDSIIEFSTNECQLTSENDLCEFFSKLKNIKTVGIDQSYDTIKAITALNESGCENIQNCYVFSEQSCANELIKLLSKQKSLYKLECLESETFNGNFFDSLPENLLEELGIHITDETSYSISRFTNLTVLELYIDNLTDRIVRNLTKCDQLIKLSFLEINNFSLTAKGMKNFAHFKNLETIIFDYFYQNVDKTLNAISYYKNLKNLGITFGHYTNIGLESISLHKNLKVLIIRNTNKNFKKLINIIIDLPKLEIVKILGSCKFSDFTLNKINDAKIKRGDKKILEILVSKRYANSETVVKKSGDRYPLVSVKFCGHFG